MPDVHEAELLTDLSMKDSSVSVSLQPCDVK